MKTVSSLQDIKRKYIKGKNRSKVKIVARRARLFVICATKPRLKRRQ